MNYIFTSRNAGIAITITVGTQGIILFFSLPQVALIIVKFARACGTKGPPC